MWIKADGQLSESSYLLTTAVSSHLLAFGEVAAIVDSGIAAYASELSDTVEAVLADAFELKYLCLTHAHFDHVGGVVKLRERFPKLELIASAKTVQLLENEQFITQLYEKNCKYLGREDPAPFSLQQFQAALKVQRVVSEGDSILLGDDVELKVVSCPGHTIDTTGYYLLPDEALSAGEAVGGFNGRDKLAPCFLDNISSYSETLDRFLALNIKFLVLPHSGVLSGDLAKRYLLGARDQVNSFSSALNEKIRDGLLKEELFFDLLGEWTTDGLSPEGPFLEEQEECLRKMIDLVSSSDIKRE